MGVEIYVRATINMPELAQGEEVWVDPEIPYIRNALEALFLIPVDAPEGEVNDGEADTGAIPVHGAALESGEE